MASFDAALLERLAVVEDVELETRRRGGRVRRTPVWAVVVDGRAYVRSWHGSRGRWYQDLVRQPDITLHVEGRAVPVTAVREEDPVVVDRVSQAYTQKYDFSAYARQYAAEMVLPETLPTTTRLVPRGA